MNPDQWYAYVCGNDGAVFKFLANYVMFPAFGLLGAAWANNSKWIQASPILGPLVRFIGGHWAGWLASAAKNAANDHPPLPGDLQTAQKQP